jgi:hypothetical protein
MPLASNSLPRGARRLAPLALVGLTLAWAAPARAQTADEQAEALFREGREAVDHGDFAAGCAKFAASLKLTQRPGPLLNLASCEEHQGHLISALAHWTEAIALLPKGDDRIESSRKRAEALGRRIPRLTVTLAPEPPTGTKITLDGATLSPAALGLPQPIDLGEHTLVTSAPGHIDAKSTLILAESERREVTVTPGLPEATTPAVVKPPVSDTPPSIASPKASGGMRTAGFVIGGVGVVSLAVGAITGVMTIGKNTAIDTTCNKMSPCPASKREEVIGLQDSGKTLSAVSTITFALGAVGLGAGVTLVLLGGPARAPKAATIAPLVLPGGGGLMMGGSF